MNADVFVGLDWAAQEHAVCVIDAGEQVLERFTVRHDRDGLAELLRRLGRYGPRVRIAIERPSGLIVDALVEGQHAVFPIHPNIVKASRARYRSHGAKSDASDAYLLADLLRTDGHRWTALAPQSDEIRALRALVRGRDDLVATRVALANQLRSTLEAFWPAATLLFCAVDSRIALAFLRCYPSPAKARNLNVAMLQSFLRDQHYTGRRSPEELLSRLQAAAPGHVGEQTSAALTEVVLAIVGVLQPLVEQLAEITRRIEHLIASLPDGQIIMSFPRAGHVCAAQILAELGDVRERFPSVERLAAEAGVVPLTYESGKKRSVGFRWACNHHLRRAITCMADNSRHANLWARGIYTAARQRGCDHPHAVRILARAWLRVLWRAWVDRKPYNPELHLGAQRVSQQGS